MTDLATLQAERERGDWYARRVYEHQAAARAHARTAGTERAAIAAGEARHHAINDHGLWVMHRVAQVVACAEAGGGLAQAAAALWLTPEGLRSWLERHDRGLLARLRANNNQLTQEGAA